jgi:phytoene/squalene synthetase
MSEAAEGNSGSISGKRGRKSERPAERLARLEQEVKEARAAAKEAERKAFAIVGQAVLAEAEGDGELKARMQDILRRRVRGNTNRAAIAGLLLP